MSGELPGEVLRELRERHHRSRRAFGDLVGWGANVQRNLEQGRTRLTDLHVKELIKKLAEFEWITEGDEWCQRFEAAFEYEWQLEQDEDEEDQDAIDPDAPMTWPPSRSVPMVIPQPPEPEPRSQRPQWMAIAGITAVVVLLVAAIYGGYRLGTRARDQIVQQNDEDPAVIAEGGGTVGPEDPGQTSNDDPTEQMIIATDTTEPSPTATFTPMPTYTPYPTYTEVPTLTPKPNPSNTPYPTYTKYPTSTPYPTDTRIPKTPTVTKSPTITPTSTPRTTLPFSDNFDTGLKDDWRIDSGDWRIINGRLTDISDVDTSALLVGDTSWKNYRVRVHYDSNTLRWQGVGIVVSAQDGNNYLTFEVDSYDSYWYLKKGGTWTQLAKGKGTGDHDPSPSRGYISVEVKDGFYRAYLDDDLVLSVSDSSFESGAVGLMIIECTGTGCLTYDNFSVTPLD